MNTNLDFIKESAYGMYTDKLDNMTYVEITDEIACFLEDKADQVVNALCDLMRNNEVVNTNTKIRALDTFTYDLIDNWEMYDGFENVEELSDEIIDNCSTETMDEISYDALYNYDALWMTAIHKAFPKDTTDTQCGFGEIRLIRPYDVKVVVHDSGYYEGIMASSPEEAEAKAAEMFRNGDTSWECSGIYDSWDVIAEIDE